eukprot:SAG11_NODE_11675_length_745_cov_0.735294_1_plen_41_part_10
MFVTPQGALFYVGSTMGSALGSAGAGVALGRGVSFRQLGAA